MCWNATINMRTNPIAPIPPGLSLPHRHRLLKHRDNPTRLLQLPTIQLQTNPIPRRIRIEMIGRLDQTLRNGRGVGEFPDFVEGGREVGSGFRGAFFPEGFLTHVVDFANVVVLGVVDFATATATVAVVAVVIARTLVKRLQIVHDISNAFVARIVFAPTSLGTKGRKTKRNVLCVPHGKDGTESRALSNQNGLTGRHRENLFAIGGVFEMVDVDLPVRDVEVFVVLDGEPGFRGGLGDGHEGEGEGVTVAVGGGGDVADAFADGEAVVLHDYLAFSDDLDALGGAAHAVIVSVVVSVAVEVEVAVDRRMILVLALLFVAGRVVCLW